MEFYSLSDRGFLGKGYVVGYALLDGEKINEPYKTCENCKTILPEREEEFIDAKVLLEKGVGTRWGDIMKVRGWYGKNLFSENAVKAIFDCNKIPEFCYKMEIIEVPSTKKLDMSKMPDYYWIDEMAIRTVKMDYNKSGAPVTEYCNLCGFPLFDIDKLSEFLSKDVSYFVDMDTYSGEEIFTMDFFPYYVCNENVVERIVASGLTNFRLLPLGLAGKDEYVLCKGMQYWKKGFNLKDFLRNPVYETDNVF